MDQVKLNYESPLHAYAIMLHERVERCEDEIDRLRGTIEEMKRNAHLYWTGRYFKITNTIAVGDPRTLDTVRKNAMDAVFRHRNKFHPLFAYMKWLHEGNTFRMDTYLIVKDPVSLLQMQAWIPDALVCSYEGAYGELKARIKNDIGYYLSMPAPHDDIGAELWKVGGDGMEFELQEDMTCPEEAFTSSPNYCGVFALQCLLHEQVRHRNWFELFGQQVCA